MSYLRASLRGLSFALILVGAGACFSAFAQEPGKLRTRPKSQAM